MNVPCSSLVLLRNWPNFTVAHALAPSTAATTVLLSWAETQQSSMNHISSWYASLLLCLHHLLDLQLILRRHLLCLQLFFGGPLLCRLWEQVLNLPGQTGKGFIVLAMFHVCKFKDSNNEASGPCLELAKTWRVRHSIIVVALQSKASFCSLFRPVVLMLATIMLIGRGDGEKHAHIMQNLDSANCQQKYRQKVGFSKLSAKISTKIGFSKLSATTFCIQQIFSKNDDRWNGFSKLSAKFSLMTQQLAIEALN